MKEDTSVGKLRARLVGKTVTSVDQSPLSESYYFIRTSDGESFHICGTELGSWIVDGPRHDGTFPTIDSLVRVVTDHRYEKRMYDEVIEVIVVDGVMVVDAGDGTTFQVRPHEIRNPWERKVLAHAEAPRFMGKVLESGETWMMWFDRDRMSELKHAPNQPRVPPDLWLSRAEIKLRL